MFIRFIIASFLCGHLFAQTATIRGSSGGAHSDAVVMIGSRSHQTDTDSDGLSDHEELVTGSDPFENQFQTNPDGAGLVNHGGINLADGLRAVWGFEKIENGKSLDSGPFGFHADIIQNPGSTDAVIHSPDVGIFYPRSAISQSVVIQRGQGYMRADSGVIATCRETTIAFLIKMGNWGSPRPNSINVPIFSLMGNAGSSIDLSYSRSNDQEFIRVEAGIPGAWQAAVTPSLR